MSSNGANMPADVPSQVIPPIVHKFTPREIEFIQAVMTVSPTGFFKGCTPGFDLSYRVLGVAAFALMDFNVTNPCTNYTLENFPKEIKPMLVLGSQVFMLAMAQAGFALIDINYNDNGFSLSVDRSAKIRAAYDTLKELWKEQIRNYKNCFMMHNGGVGLGTPRFQSNIGRFIGMLGGGAFGWNIP